MPGLLHNIRVLDLTSIWAGPLGTRWLADMGADVIKVQETPKLTPQIALRLRRLRELAHKDGEGPATPPTTAEAIALAQAHGVTGYVLQTEGNKRSISLDYESPKGREIIKRLVPMCDIVIDNHRPIVLERNALDYKHLRKLRPDLIMLAVSAMGNTGPERNYSGFGATIDGLGGLAFHTGYPGDDHPTRSGINYADPVIGMYVGGALMLALLHRKRTGEGQYIDISLRDALVSELGELFMEYSANGRPFPRMGNREPGVAPHGVYRTKGEDRWIAIAVNSDAEWLALCAAIGNPPWTRDQRFVDMNSRWRHHDELDAHLNASTAPEDANALAERLQAGGVAATPVLTPPEILATPQHEARGWWKTHAQKDIGDYHYFGPGWRLSRTPAELRTPPPDYGAHNREIYQGLLRMSDDEYAALLAERVVSESPLPDLATSEPVTAPRL